MTDERARPSRVTGQDDGRLGDLLEARRRLAFVGREQALATAETLFEDAAEQRCLYFHGPGGIGKTSLLQRVRERAIRRGLTTLQLDARLIPPTPQGIREALQTPLSGPGHGTVVWLLDTCEHLGPVLTWMFNDFLAGLDRRVRLIAAGRVAPEGVASVALQELSTMEVDHYLRRRGVHPDDGDPIRVVTGGHPLALAMACDLATTRAGPAVWPGGSIIATELARRMLSDAGSPAQTRALRAAALVRTLSPALLACMLPEDDGSELFHRLARLSCIETGAQTLMMHDIAREAIASELREQAPELHECLCRRAEDYYRTQFSGADTAAAARAIHEVSFLSRDLPMMRALQERIAQSSVYPDAPRPDEARVVAAWIEHFQGASQRRCFEYWQSLQPEGLTVFRAADGSPTGCALTLAVEGLNAADTRSDAIVDAYRRRIRQLGLPPGWHAGLIRFWLDARHHMAPSAVQAHTLSLPIALATARADTAFMGLVEPDQPATHGMAELAGHEMLTVSPARLGDTPIVVALHDWREEPVLDWLIRVNRRARRQASTTSQFTPP